MFFFNIHKLKCKSKEDVELFVSSGIFWDKKKIKAQENRLDNEGWNDFWDKCFKAH